MRDVRESQGDQLQCSERTLIIDQFELSCTALATVMNWLRFYCLSNAMHSSIGHNIKSHGVSSLQYPISDVQTLASVDKTVTSFMDRSSPNLEHSFSVTCTNKFFWAGWLDAAIAHAWPKSDCCSLCPSLGVGINALMLFSLNTVASVMIISINSVNWLN